MSLPLWKVRHRIRLCGTQKHNSRGPNRTFNNRHWNPTANNNRGGWLNTLEERKMEDIIWKEIHDWIYGALVVYGDLYRRSGEPDNEVLMDLYRLIKCCPSIPDFYRRRLEVSHPKHQRHSICLESHISHVRDEWKRLGARAARDAASLEPRLRLNWQKQLLGSTVCSVLVLVPEDFTGRNQSFVSNCVVPFMLFY